MTDLQLIKALGILGAKIVVWSTVGMMLIVATLVLSHILGCASQSVQPEPYVSQVPHTQLELGPLEMPKFNPYRREFDHDGI